jgi:putative endonuclease
MNFRWLSRWWSPPADLGARGEAAVAKYLKRKGYKIVAHGQRSRMGEIDLIAVDSAPARRGVVFVEVKTRTSDQAGRPDEAVDLKKQAKLTKICLAYLKRHDLLECRARFDIVAVTWPESAKKPTIEHYENAFEAVGDGQFFS